ncbi:MAG: hypothetical protein ACHQHN_03000 [Sphingobacteriales bacterium]
METQVRTSPITGKEGAEIELAVATEWTKNHREKHPYSSISQFFGIEILQRLLQQPDCLGIRIYYANSLKLSGWQKFIVGIANFLTKSVGAVGEDHFILVGSTAEGIDQIPKGDLAATAESNIQPRAFTTNAAAPNTATQDLVVEQSHPCPGSAGCPKNVLTGSIKP